jgi:hypothetical protein
MTVMQQSCIGFQQFSQYHLLMCTSVQYGRSHSAANRKTTELTANCAMSAVRLRHGLQKKCCFPGAFQCMSEKSFRGLRRPRTPADGMPDRPLACQEPRDGIPRVGVKRKKKHWSCIVACNGSMVHMTCQLCAWLGPAGALRLPHDPAAHATQNTQYKARDRLMSRPEANSGAVLPSRPVSLLASML